MAEMRPWGWLFILAASIMLLSAFGNHDKDAGKVIIVMSIIWMGFWSAWQ